MTESLRFLNRFLDACRKGDVDTLQELFIMDVNRALARDWEEGMSLAARSGHFSAVMFLVSKNQVVINWDRIISAGHKHPKIFTFLFYTAQKGGFKLRWNIVLMYACTHGDTQIINDIIETTPDLDWNYGLFNSHIDIIRQMVELGTQYTRRMNWNDAILSAAKHGYHDIAEYLIGCSQGCDLNWSHITEAVCRHGSLVFFAAMIAHTRARHYRLNWSNILIAVAKYGRVELLVYVADYTNQLKFNLDWALCMKTAIDHNQIEIVKLVAKYAHTLETTTFTWSWIILKFVSKPQFQKDFESRAYIFDKAIKFYLNRLGAVPRWVSEHFASDMRYVRHTLDLGPYTPDKLIELFPAQAQLIQTVKEEHAAVRVALTSYITDVLTYIIVDYVGYH